MARQNNLQISRQAAVGWCARILDTSPFAPILVGIVAFAVFAGTVHFDLVWDDLGLREYVLRLFRQEGIPGLLKAEFTSFTGAEGAVRYYRPVVLLSLLADAQMSRFIPQVFHLTNVILHAAVSLLAYRLLRRILGSGITCLFGALLFAVHPVHVESVAFVSGRTDLWAAFFTLLAILFWCRSRETEGWQQPAALAAGALSFLAALLSKEVAFMLPAVLAAWDLLESPLRRASWWRRNRAWILAWGTALAVALLLRGVAQGTPPSQDQGHPVPVGSSTLLATPLTLLRLVVLPWPLRPLYTPDEVRLDGAVFAAILLLGAAAFLALRSSAGRIPGALGLVWMAVFLAPVSGILPLDVAPAAERLLYLPSLGACLLVAAAAGCCPRRTLRRQFLIAAGSTIVLLAAMASVRQAHIWRNQEALFSAMVAGAPGSASAHYNLARVREEQGLLPEAIREYERAIDAERGYLPAWTNLGVAWARLGRSDRATEAFREVLRFDPDNFGAQVNLALVLARTGREDLAVASLRKAKAIRPSDIEVRVHLALTLVRRGDRAGAAREIEELAGLDPVQGGRLKQFLGL